MNYGSGSSPMAAYKYEHLSGRNVGVHADMKIIAYRTFIRSEYRQVALCEF